MRSVVWICCLSLAGCSQSPSAAEDVSFDPAVSGLVADNVKTALDELAASQSTVSGRVQALEDGGTGDVAASAVSYDSTATGMAGENAQGAIDELHGIADNTAFLLAGLTAGDVPAKGAPSVQSALDQLTTDVAAIPSHEEDIKTLKADVAALVSELGTAKEETKALQVELTALRARVDPTNVGCPDGLIPVGTACVDPEPSSGTWGFAATLCVTRNMRLCHPGELRNCGGFQVAGGTPATAPELTSEIFADTNVRTQHCLVEGSAPAGENDLHPYRCCVDKANAVFVAPIVD